MVPRTAHEVTSQTALTSAAASDPNATAEKLPQIEGSTLCVFFETCGGVGLTFLKGVEMQPLEPENTGAGPKFSLAQVAEVAAGR